MLQKIHDRVKGWIAGVIIAVISATFVLWGVQYYLQSSGSDGSTVAKVNGDKITLKQLAASVQQLQREYMMKSGHVLTDIQNQELQQFALQNLIMNSVLLQSAQRIGFRVSADQVNAFIMGMPQYQENGQFSALRYQQLLYANSLTPLAFMTQLSNELVVQQIENGIESTAFVLPNEVQRDYVLAHQQRDFGYVVIPQTQFLNSVKVTDKMLVDYYQQHHHEFKSPEQVSVEYLMISPQDVRKQINMSDAEVKQYYEDNIANYRAQKKNTLAAAKMDITKVLLQQKINAILTKDSDQLSDIAYANPTTLKLAADALHLQLKTSALFSRQDNNQGMLADPKIITAAFSDEVLQGNNSDPIQLKDGSIVILRIKQHQPSHLLSLTQVTPQIQQILKQQMVQAAAATVAAKIAKMINQHQSSINILKSYQLFWKSAVNISRDNKSVPSTIVAAAFALALKNNVTTTVLTNGDVAVIQLRAVKSPAHPSPANSSQILEQNLLSDWGRLEYQLYVKGSRDRARIKMMMPSAQYSK